MRSWKLRELVIFACLLAWAGSAGAGRTDEVKCQLKKLKAANKYAACRLKAEVKAIKKSKEQSVLPDFTKCDLKFTDKWAKAELKYGENCTTESDAVSIQSQLDLQTLSVLNTLMPNTVAFACDALDQDDCPGQACYVNIVTADPPESSCQNVFFGLTQGQPCEFVNGCAPGFGCLLPPGLEDPNNLQCAFHCDAQGSSPSCVEGPGPAFVCVAANVFYGDVDRAPADFGFCIDPLEFPLP